MNKYIMNFMDHLIHYNFYYQSLRVLHEVFFIDATQLMAVLKDKYVLRL